MNILVRIKKIIVVIVLVLNALALFGKDICIPFPKEEITLIEEIPFNKEIAIAYALLSIRQDKKNGGLVEVFDEFNLDKVYMGSFTNIDNKNIVVLAFPSEGEEISRLIELEIKDRFFYISGGGVFAENAKVLIEEMYR